MHVLRRAFFPAVFPASAVLARAGVSYDESAVFSFDTRDYLAGLAAESAVFTFDTRAVDGLQGAAVSGSFAFNTRGATLPPLQITGVLRDSAGVPVAGATIQIKRAGAIFWQGVSGAGGAFTTPNLSGVNYTVIVTKPGYVTSITNITGTGGGNLAPNIVLQSLTVAPNTVTTNRTLSATAVRAGPNTSDPAYPVLERFVGTQLVYDLTRLDPNQMTVVITHGWVPLEVADSYATALDWVKQLAFLIQNHHPGTTQPPNILVWDWRHKANTAAPQVDDAAEEGIELGKARRASPLGVNYSNRLHFIGHSLGTIVNRYACDYVHGSLSGYQSRDNPSNPWPAASTNPHVTLLDEAEVATVFGQKVLTSAALAGALTNLEGALVAASVEAKLDWKYPIPKDARWVDNYISMFGLQHGGAVNVCLPALATASEVLVHPLTAVSDAHSYAHLWYRNSVNPSGPMPSVGYGSSFESTAVFPPSGAGKTNGSLWLENLDTPDSLDLTLDLNPEANEATLKIVAALSIAPAAGAAGIGNAVIYQPLDALGRSVLNGYAASIQFTGNALGTVIYKTGEVGSEVTQKIGNWWDAGQDAAADVLNSVNPETLLANPLAASVFKIRLQTQAAPAPLAGNKGQASLAGQPAYAWVTVAVPADAGLMAFDFTVTGDPQEDKIACAINDQNVFTLPAKFAPDGQPVSTDMIDVSAYAGQSIELFFGLAGGTSTNCEVAIDGLRFITVPPPKIALAPAGANVAIKWPAAASGWVLESTDALAPANWQTVSTASGVTVESGVATLEELMSGPRKFYRLRRAP